MTQADALAILKTGTNVCLTGEPGAGKSHTVREYMRFLQSHGIAAALTASTGIAATHIGGVTIHSWSGLGIRKYISKGECRELASNKKVAKRVREARVLIIDEVSMLDAAMVDAVDTICRSLRGSGESFGGLQVVFVGDFFQLPPVARPGEPPARFAFESSAWQQARLTVCYLSEQHRQEDGRFLEVLGALRRGSLNEDHIACLQERCGVQPKDAQLTKLFAHNVDVDTLNGKRLESLPGKPKTYTMESYGDPRIVEAMKRTCLSPEQLVLKVEARIMCTRNNPAKGYVNGSLGTVVGFDHETGYPTVRLHTGRTVYMEPETWSADVNGESLAAIRQIPLRLAWAITIHKSQGMSLDAAYMDLRDAFAYGQGYVALSRVRTLDGLFLAGLNERSLQIDPSVLLYDSVLREQSLSAESVVTQMSSEEREKKAQVFVQRCGGHAEAVEVAVPNASEPWKPAKKVREPKWTQTLTLFLEGKTIQEVATTRARTIGTILDHLVAMQKAGKLPSELATTLKASAEPMTKEIHPIMEELGVDFLGPVYARLEGKYSYDDLKIAQWCLQSESVV